MNFSIKSNVIDVFNKRIYPATLVVEDSIIKAIEPLDETAAPLHNYLLPGFIDAHVHIESSMLVPAEFARLAVVHGTVATVSDPHEIANVCGLAGVEYMIENGNTVPFKFNFGAPSCVPATAFETAGATLNANDVKALLARDEIKYLSEMMNFPGVLNKDPEVLQKIAAAKQYFKPVDGHAPGLRGELAKQYIAAGMSTDHECFTAEEAQEKLQQGMKILIREGSAAKNFDALIDLLNDYPEMIMFCSDDKHPDSLVEGHINQLCARAIERGIDVFKILQAACVNPVLHYQLAVGLVRVGDPADFIIVNDLRSFQVEQTFINGERVAANGISFIKKDEEKNVKPVNQFNCSRKQVSDFAMPATTNKNIPVIEALDGQLITNKLSLAPKLENNLLVSDVANDILKIVVVNRYTEAPVAKAFIQNFGLQSGAIASSVAHDSHNIVAVGADDKSLCEAINLIIEKEGGVSCVGNGEQHILALPVAGLMTTADGYEVASAYATIDAAAKALGSKLTSPFMTLSFMALLVIPHLKLSDKGLFDGDSFSFCNL